MCPGPGPSCADTPASRDEAERPGMCLSRGHHGQSRCFLCLLGPSARRVGSCEGSGGRVGWLGAPGPGPQLMVRRDLPTLG